MKKALQKNIKNENVMDRIRAHDLEGAASQANKIRACLYNVMNVIKIRMDR